MKGTKFVQSILKELYQNLLSDFKSKCGLWFFLNLCRVRIEQGECIWKGGKEMIKPSCVHAPPPVHDVVRCLLFFNGGVAHPNTSFELYLLFIQRQKHVKITGTLLVGNTRESNLLDWIFLKKFTSFFFYYFLFWQYWIF